jgi:hypothetical protein
MLSSFNVVSSDVAVGEDLLVLSLNLLRVP